MVVNSQESEDLGNSFWLRTSGWELSSQLGQECCVLGCMALGVRIRSGKGAYLCGEFVLRPGAHSWKQVWDLLKSAGMVPEPRLLPAARPWPHLPLPERCYSSQVSMAFSCSWAGAGGWRLLPPFSSPYHCTGSSPFSVYCSCCHLDLLCVNKSPVVSFREGSNKCGPKSSRCLKLVATLHCGPWDWGKRRSFALARHTQTGCCMLCVCLHFFTLGVARAGIVLISRLFLCCVTAFFYHCIYMMNTGFL